MNTATNFRISIPKPCHEDWSKMTPDEKGAFCKVCNKSVHDFTKKEPEQIKIILIEEISAGKKVCGRFNEDQITTPTLKGEKHGWSAESFSLNFQKLKKFAAALILVFGGFLFTSVKSSAQKMGKVAFNYREPVRGEIAIVNPETKDTVKKTVCEKPKGDVKIEPIEKQSVLGGAVMIEEPVVKNIPAIAQTKGQVTIIETVPSAEDTSEIKITGDTAVLVEPVEEVPKEMPLMGAIAITDIEDSVTTPWLIEPVLADNIQNIIDGEFAVEESTYVETGEVAIKEEMRIVSADENAAALISLSVYLNPSSNGEINLSYAIKKDGIASIILYDLNGNITKTFMPAQSLYASTYETRYDVSDLKDGVYICELVSGDVKITTRVLISR